MLRCEVDTVDPVEEPVEDLGRSGLRIQDLPELPVLDGNRVLPDLFRREEVAQLTVASRSIHPFLGDFRASLEALFHIQPRLAPSRCDLVQEICRGHADELEVLGVSQARDEDVDLPDRLERGERLREQLRTLC